MYKHKGAFKRCTLHNILLFTIIQTYKITASYEICKLVGFKASVVRTKKTTVSC